MVDSSNTCPAKRSEKNLFLFVSCQICRYLTVGGVPRQYPGEGGKKKIEERDGKGISWLFNLLPLPHFPGLSVGQ